MNEHRNPPAEKSGLYRILGALLLRDTTEPNVTGEVGAITHKQLSFELSINCPVVSWANLSIGALKALINVYYDSHLESDLSVGNKNFSLEGS